MMNKILVTTIAMLLALILTLLLLERREKAPVSKPQTPQVQVAVSPEPESAQPREPEEEVIPRTACKNIHPGEILAAIGKKPGLTKSFDLIYHLKYYYVCKAVSGNNPGRCMPFDSSKLSKQIAEGLGDECRYNYDKFKFMVSFVVKQYRSSACMRFYAAEQRQMKLPDPDPWWDPNDMGKARKFCEIVYSEYDKTGNFLSLCPSLHSAGVLNPRKDILKMCRADLFPSRPKDCFVFSSKEESYYRTECESQIRVLKALRMQNAKLCPSSSAWGGSACRVMTESAGCRDMLAGISKMYCQQLLSRPRM